MKPEVQKIIAKLAKTTQKVELELEDYGIYESELNSLFKEAEKYKQNLENIKDTVLKNKTALGELSQKASSILKGAAKTAEKDVNLLKRVGVDSSVIIDELSRIKKLEDKLQGRISTYRRIIQ